MLRVGDLMRLVSITISADTPLKEARQLMFEQKQSHLPVVEGEKLVGVIAEQEIDAIVSTPFLQTGTVGLLMNKEPLLVTPITPAYRAAEMLRSYGFRTLFVIENQRVVGMISVDDFLNHATGSKVLPFTLEQFFLKVEMI